MIKSDIEIIRIFNVNKEDITEGEFGRITKISPSTSIFINYDYPRMAKTYTGIVQIRSSKTIIDINKI